MPLFWTEPDYLLVLAGWLIGMALSLVAMLRLRRTLRRQHRLTSWRAVGFGLTMSLWSILATVTALEVAFVLFVDQSDAFNGTNVSKRWFRRYIDGQRNDGGRGFRDRRTLDMPVPKGTKRIVVYGDSFVAGHGIKRMNDRFTERLERKFNADGVEHVQVHNLGEPGYEVSMIEAIMQATLETYGAIDVVIYCYMMNDIEGYDPRTEQFLREVNSRAPTHPLITRTYFLNWVYFRWQQLRTDAAVNYFPHLKDSYNTPAWKNVAASLDRMKQRCEAKGVEFRLVVFPFMQDLGPDYPFRDAHRKVADWARDHDVPLIDMEPLLAAHRHEGLAVNAFDSHPNEYANKLIADAIYEWLKTDPRLSGPASR